MKKFKVLLFLILTLLLTKNTFASTVDEIKAVLNNTVEITTSDDIVFSDSFVEGDIKILKNMNILFSEKDYSNPRKVLLNLSENLEINSSYSLISILGAEGNIDFKIGDYVEGEIVNEELIEGEKGIEKINIIDSKTLELYYNYDLTDDLFEFKILNDIITTGLFSKGNNIVDLLIKGSLENNTNYILMILDLKDIDGNKIILNEDLYDFTTPDNLVQDIEPKDIILAAAKDIEEEGNIEEVALSIKKTPDTGSATWVLILLTFIVNMAFFFRKKFFKIKFS